LRPALGPMARRSRARLGLRPRTPTFWVARNVIGYGDLSPSCECTLRMTCECTLRVTCECTLRMTCECTLRVTCEGTLRVTGSRGRAPGMPS
jgi:hypothetical protein